MKNVRIMTGRGFTLAEVLITLGIIGVVAALTIPNLIAKHQDKVRVTALKKFYSTTAQAINLAKAASGDLNDASIDFSAAGTGTNGPELLEWFNTAIKPYIKILKVETNPSAIYYTTVDGAYVNLDDFSPAQAALYGTTTSSMVLHFIVDIDGPKKGPNTIGKDKFMFYLTKERGLVPAGVDDSSACDSDKKSYTCTAVVLEKGTTNY